MYPFTKFITINKSICSYNREICFKKYMINIDKKSGIKFLVKACAYSWYIYIISFLIQEKLFPMIKILELELQLKKKCQKDRK